MRNVELAEALFRAVTRGDVETIRSLCSLELQLHQNLGPPMTVDGLIELVQGVLRVVANFRYEDPIRSETDTGFVEEHRVCGTLPDGSPLDLPACVVAEVREGRITRVREYLDGVAAGGLMEALSR